MDHEVYVFPWGEKIMADVPFILGEAGKTAIALPTVPYPSLKHILTTLPKALVSSFRAKPKRYTKKFIRELIFNYHIIILFIYI